MSTGVKNLIEAYPEDVDETFLAELRHFHLYVKKKCSEQKKFSHQDLYTVIFEDKVQSAFPNVESVLRLFLSLMVTNCSGERSFSQLKRIKNQLRSSLSQEKLTSLSVMCIESDKLRELSFDKITEDSAGSKARKQMF